MSYSLQNVIFGDSISLSDGLYIVGSDSEVIQSGVDFLHRRLQNSGIETREVKFRYTGVSSLHAAISWEGSRGTLYNLGSSNSFLVRNNSGFRDEREVSLLEQNIFGGMLKYVSIMHEELRRYSQRVSDLESTDLFEGDRLCFGRHEIFRIVREDS